MKRILLLMTIMAVSLASYAQEEQQPSPQQQQGNALTAHYATIYQRAIRYNDYGAAKNALYGLVNMYPQNDSLLYSLSLLYYQMQQFASAALTSRDVLSLNPDHTGAMEIGAISYQQIGAKDRAIESYEKLFLATNDFQTLYQLAFLQYEAGRLNESLANADLLLGKKEAAELKVTYTGANNQQQEFPIKAALLNLKGLISQQQGNMKEARAFYNQALEIAPGFELAKENLKGLDSK